MTYDFVIALFVSVGIDRLYTADWRRDCLTQSSLTYDFIITPLSHKAS